MKIETTIYRCDYKTQAEQDIQVTVEFDYQAAEPQELNYPGCDEWIDITAIKTLDGDTFDVNMTEESDIELTCLIAYRAGKIK